MSPDEDAETMVSLPIEDQYTALSEKQLGRHAPKSVSVVYPPPFSSSFVEMLDPRDTRVQEERGRKRQRTDSSSKDTMLSDATQTTTSSVKRSNAFMSVENPQAKGWTGLDLPSTYVLNRPDIMLQDHTPHLVQEKLSIAERRALKKGIRARSLDVTRTSSDSTNLEDNLVPHHIITKRKIKRDPTPPPLPIVYDADSHLHLSPDHFHVTNEDLAYPYLETTHDVPDHLRIHCPHCHKLQETDVNKTLTGRGVLRMLAGAPVMIPAAIVSSVTGDSLSVVGKKGYDRIHRCTKCHRVLLSVEAE